MASAKELLAKAVSQIGYKESPSGSNNTKYGKWYGLNYNPWCDMFVSWCADQIGAGNIIGKYAYCPSHVNYFKKKGWWLDREEKPQPGDIIFFSNGSRACHVGIVEKRNGTKSVTTIEGNTSVTSNDNGGAVMRRTRTYGAVGSSWYIMGFARPNYSGASGTVTSGSSSSSKPSSSSTSGKSAIKEVQKWCNNNYNYSQTVDGINGKNTKKGLIKALQTELNKQFGKGLAVDGIWGPKTAAACVNVKKGAQGNLTKTLQGALICLGYSTNGFDGIFGSGTDSAVRKFQKAKGLTVDGIAGSRTWKALLG